MTYEVIDARYGNTVASFGTFDAAWDAFMELEGVILGIFDAEGSDIDTRVPNDDVALHP